MSTQSGGLDRFLNEIVPLQRSLYDVQCLHPLQSDLDDLGAAIRNSNSSNLIEIGRQILNKQQYDIVHLHDWYGGVFLDSLYSLRNRRIVLTSHLPLRCGFTYYDSSFDNYEKLLYEQRVISAAHAIISPSLFCSEFLLSEYGIHKTLLNVVANGVNSDSFRNKNVVRDPRKLLFVGRLVEQKGIPLLVRALREIVQRREMASLTIIGSGTQEHTIRDLVRELNLGDFVELKSAVDAESLAMEYSSAGLLVIPSYFEPFGLVGLEAMACGCPVLGFEPNGMSEYLLESEQFSSLVPNDLACRILEQLEIGDRVDDTAQSIRARTLDHSWQGTVEKYHDIYQRVMS